MKQGDIVIVTLDPTRGHEQSKTRPCIIIQQNTLNTYLGTTIIIPITSTQIKGKYPNVVEIHNTHSGLVKQSFAKIEQLRCIDKSRILKKIGEVSSEEMNLLHKGLQTVFGIEC